ncbi:MAG: hypothetical protein D6725_15380, partial [Planctomycetota bacterium]
HLKYDSYGNITAIEDAAGNPTTLHSPLSTPHYAYTGRVWDADAQLYYYRARRYDPAAGRFISEDPVGFAAGDANISRYAGNSPTNATDASGLFEIEWGSEFSENEKKLITDSLSRIRTKVEQLLEEIDKELDSLDESLRSQLDYEVSNLRRVLIGVKEDIDSQSKNLEIYRENEPDADRRAEAWDNWPFFWFDDEITLNDAHGWTESTESDLDELLFHELTHFHNTYDDDRLGNLMNAHTIDGMITGSFKDSTIWTYVKNHSEKAKQPPWDAAYIDYNGDLHIPLGP